MERGWREMPPNCPRCGSTNTKFCYYNNYSLTQPRYFCKGCRRYWTKGGSLRNVPVGGGCRKTRRGNKPSLRISNSTPASIPYPSSCYRSTTLGAFGHALMNSSEGSSSSASTIDLAMVYANFVKPKMPHQHHERRGPHLSSNNNNNDNHFTSPPLDQSLLHHHSHDKQLDQGLMPNPSLFAYYGPQLEEEVVIPWAKNGQPDDQLVMSSCNDNNALLESHALQSPILMQNPLEAEAQFTSLFNMEGCWSPIDFSGYNPDVQMPVDSTATAGIVSQWP